MKKLFTLLLILLATVYSFAQQNYRTETEWSSRPADVVFYGEGKKSEQLKTIYDFIPGNNYQATYGISTGYDKKGNQVSGGDWVLAIVQWPTGEEIYREYIQLSDAREREALPILDRTSNLSSDYVKAICTQQFNALKRIFRKAEDNPYSYQVKNRYYTGIPPAKETRACDCNVYVEKKDPVVKLDPDLTSYSAGAYSGYNANFGALPNQIPGTDFSQVTIVKEKGKYGWIWKTLAGVVIGYILTDGLSDGEWFDFNFEKPQTIVVDGPPGGPDLNPSSLIMRTSNYQLQQQLQSMMPQNNAPPSIGFSFNIGL